MGVVSNKVNITDLQKGQGGGTGDLPGRVTALETVVGDSTSGLVKDVDNLETVVGDESSGLVKDVAELKGATSTIYSTTEKVIGEWINGKTLYQKTINFGALPNSTSKMVAHEISNLDKVIYLTGISSTSNGTTIPLPYVHENNQLVRLSSSSTEIVVTTTSDRRDYVNSYITLRYTKTTD